MIDLRTTGECVGQVGINHGPVSSVTSTRPMPVSIALAEGLGAVLDPDAPRQDPDDLVYRHF